MSGTTPFSNILDISSFFVGMIINLLLVALVCYYFKRKFDSMESAQNEQAKILFNLIQSNNSQPSVFLSGENSENNSLFSELNNKEDSDEDSDEDTDEDSDSDDESSVTNDTTKEINIGEINDYNNLMLSDISSSIINIEKEENIEPDAETEVESVDKPELEDDVEANTEPEVETEEDNNSESSEQVDYDKMTINELKTELSNKGVVVSTSQRLKKKELIELLNNNEE